MLRGIQIVGLLIALFALAFIVFARKKKRLNARFFLFWVMFWSIFIIIDLYPSLVASFTSALDLGSNMFILTAGSVLTLFVFVFVLYSFLYDLNRKVTALIREQAIINRELAKVLEVIDRDEKESSNSNTCS